MYANGGLKRGIQTAKKDIGDILQSGKYYCNEEIARELTAINNGLDHLGLDNTFISTSPEWKRSKEPEATSAAPNNSAILHGIGGYLSNYKNEMDLNKLHGKQENEIRELHQWAITNLHNVQDRMMPFTLSAADRIRQFGEHVGVTDRFTGYRNNLTRTAREPDPSMFARPCSLSRCHTTMGSPSKEQRTMFGLQTAQNYGAMGKKVTFGSHHPASWTLRGYRTLDSLYPKSTAKSTNGGWRPGTALADVKAMNALNAQSMASGEYASTGAQGASLMSKPPTTMSIQEQAGINTKFPGKTEYTCRYARPPPSGPTSPFIINPKPDMSIYGRPLSSAPYYPMSTEYQTRYEWPDGNKIIKLPWLRT